MSEQPGHNSSAQLKSIVERIERLDTDIKDLRSDQNDIYKEAGGNGYDVKVLRKVIALRRQDPAARAEQEAILETYMHQLGMLG